MICNRFHRIRQGLERPLRGNLCSIDDTQCRTDGLGAQIETEETLSGGKVRRQLGDGDDWQGLLYVSRTPGLKASHLIIARSPDRIDVSVPIRLH